MTQNGKNRRRQTPESRFYDQLKGKEVILILMTNEILRATLLWVDRYSLGIRLYDSNRELLMNKRSVQTIELAEKQNTSMTTRERDDGDYDRGAAIQ